MTLTKKAVIISALWSSNIDKYEHLTGEEILPSNRQHIIEQAKFNYSLLEKKVWKTNKKFEDHGERQVRALEDLKLKKTNKINQRNFYKRLWECWN